MNEQSYPNEVELARRLMAGDQDAFEPFVELFRKKLFQFTFLTCGHREDAEEVAQETLLKVFTSFPQLRDAENVRPWVFRIARNACTSKRRKSVFAPHEEVPLDVLQQMGKDIADWKKIPEQAAISEELNSALRAAIRGLPDIYQTVLLLRDVEGLSTKETAEVLDIEEDAVKTRLHRARLVVRQELDTHMKGNR